MLMPEAIKVEDLVIYSNQLSKLQSESTEFQNSQPVQITEEESSSFIILNNDTNSSILRGTFHQGHSRLGTIAGIQCAAIATVAIVMSSMTEFKN